MLETEFIILLLQEFCMLMNGEICLKLILAGQNKLKSKRNKW